ncbi:MAG: GntR family transcriptional regulator [Cytophagales bacterium]|nr:GntR family transcriptional regulator [Cytophagales bacterium]
MNITEDVLSFDINEKSNLPKYRQLINSINENIETGRLEFGQKLPSINELSFQYFISRDTVEKAFRHLKDNAIIESVRGKGYYVTNSSPQSKIKVLMVFNQLSEHKKIIYNSFVDAMGSRAQIDFFIYHNDYEQFEQIINEHLRGYHYHVIMPHFKKFKQTELVGLMRNLESKKLVLLDNLVKGLEDYCGAVYQDSKLDIFNALESALDLLKKYKKMILVFPKEPVNVHPKEIIEGFRSFCGFNEFNCEIITGMSEDSKIEKNSAYIVVDDTDLVKIIKNIRSKKLKLSKDVGIISYNDTVLKEVLAEGITVITPDFKQMGTQAAEMILNHRFVEIKNDFKLIQRKSL